MFSPLNSNSRIGSIFLVRFTLNWVSLYYNLITKRSIPIHHTYIWPQYFFSILKHIKYRARIACQFWHASVTFLLKINLSSGFSSWPSTHRLFFTTNHALNKINNWFKQSVFDGVFFAHDARIFGVMEMKNSPFFSFFLRG